ncbi:hypothetical protein MOX02_03410 [Methylobacterium oxalidis]|uniref:Uncharacterized protein n=1 Tax=Methylobacterium oxalidis TaxID=944322 RepID=A0A512IXC7_9HYPH|nr:hypothetical protein MOX02_03410 [Methylobacterium oxalidis]GLS67682.1 hypothetical protein GCM10007888_60670 [Methylobacterium oxalidis]
MSLASDTEARGIRGAIRRAYIWYRFIVLAVVEALRALIHEARQPRLKDGPPTRDQITAGRGD